MRSTGRMSKFTWEERRKIAMEYFNTGKSRGEIAKEYSISVTTVDRYVKEFKEEFSQW